MNISPEELLEDDDEEHEELPTAMELALRQAMESSPTDSQTQEARASSDRRREVQEDLLARTLSERVKTSTEGSSKED
jgi:hypothetical protein